MIRNIASLGSLSSKCVLLRSDLNVPLQDGVITDDGRIRASVPTMKKLLDVGSKVVVAAHLGRPGGVVDKKFSLAPVAKRLEQLLGVVVKFATDTVGDSAQSMVANLLPGEIVLLENLRFHEEETSKDEMQRLEFAKKLAALADCFVSDGFGVVHRKQASVYDVAKLLPSAAGDLVLNEVNVLKRITDEPVRPYTVILGGAKVADKLGVIKNLLEHADTIMFGGGMAYTILHAMGYAVADSLLEDSQKDVVLEYLDIAAKRGVEVVLPKDVLVAEKFAADTVYEVVSAKDIESSSFGAAGIGLDIGPLTVQDFSEHIAKAKTVFWNGPVGVFEMDTFSNGTKGVALALKNSAAFTIVGGGDSASAIRNLGFVDEDFGHISTGGGASLEYLEGKTLPGLTVLEGN